jgi:hypothetical protein
MLEQEPTVDDVVCGRLVEVVDVPGPEIDVPDAPLAGRFPGQGQLLGVHVNASDRAVRADGRGQLEGPLAAAAAQVEAPHPGPDPDAPEKLQRVVPFDAGQQLQPVVTPLAAAQDVVLHGAIINPEAR